ncbi:MAG: hypothetical protein U0414_39595 [Polyangiaceae bacterium]
MAENEPIALEALRHEVDRMLYAGESRAHVLSRLAAVARRAAEGSDDWLFAVRMLAVLGAGENPWKASLLARRVLAHVPHAGDVWGALGLAQSILGNFAYAARCYERALTVHATSGSKPLDSLRATLHHNLGHLYDVALDRPGDAVPHLSSALSIATRARLARTAREEIAASLAHALARSGDATRAREVLGRAIRPSRRSAHAELMAFIERS